MQLQLGKARHLVGCAARYWNSDNASTTGAALAFFCAFSLAPLLVILGQPLLQRSSYGCITPPRSSCSAQNSPPASHACVTRGPTISVSGASQAYPAFVSQRTN